MTSRIVPAIIPVSFPELRSVLDTRLPWAEEVQIDIVDGIFTPHISWPYIRSTPVSNLCEFTSRIRVEVDLMIAEPERVLESYLKAKVHAVVIHLESTQRLTDILALKDRYQFRLGLSIFNDTPIDVLIAMIPHADYVQLMGIQHIGSQGQPFDTRVLERIHALKSADPTLLVSIDGSVNKDTIPHLISAGADRCVVGSAVLSATDPQEAFNTLVSLT